MRALTLISFTLIVGFVILFHANSSESNVIPNKSRKLLEFPTYRRYYTARGGQGFETNTTYLRNLLLTGLIGISLAITAILIALFGSIKNCCNIKILKQRRTGRSLFSSKRSRNVLRVAIWVCSAVILASVATGLIGNALLSTSIRGFLNHLVFTLGDIRLKAEIITDLLYDLDEKLDFRDVETSIRVVEGGVSRVKDQIFTIDVIRKVVIYLAFQFTISTAIFGLVAGILGNHKIVFLAFIFGCISLFLMWTTYGIHLPISILLDDICVSVQEFIDENRYSDTPLRYFVECLDTGEFVTFFNALNNVTIDAMSALNSTTTEYLNFSFDFTPPSSVDVLNRLDFVVNQTTIITAQIDAELVNAPNEVFTSLNETLSRVRKILSATEVIIELFRCGYLRDFALVLRRIVCEDMLNAVITIFGGSMAVGIALWPLTIICAFAVNRFPQDKSSHKERVLLETTCLMQFGLGIVSIATIGSGVGTSVFMGVFLSVFTAVGFYGSYFANRIALIIYCLVCLLLLAVQSYLLRVAVTGVQQCAPPNCLPSTRVTEFVNVIIGSLTMLPTLFGFIFSLLYLNHLDAIRRQIYVFSQSTPPDSKRDDYDSEVDEGELRKIKLKERSSSSSGESIGK